MSTSKLEALDDYVRGLGTDAEADAFEEELFARAVAKEAPELVAHDALVATLRLLAARGTFGGTITAARFAELRAEYGDKVGLIEMPDEPSSNLVVPADAEIVVTRISLPLEDVERVDVEVAIEGVGHVKTMPDLEFDRADGALYACCEATLACQTTNVPIVSRYWGMTSRGERKLLRETRTFSVVGKSM